MNSTFRFINVYFWKSIYAPFMAFILPAILLVVLGNIFRIEYAFPGIISLTVLLITVLILPLTLSDLKKTSVFKFFGASPIGELKFALVIFGFFIIITIIAITILFLIVLMAFSKDVWVSASGKQYWIVESSNPADLLTTVAFDKGILSGLLTFSGFAMFLFAVSEEVIMGVGIGLLIVTVSKTPQLALTISIAVILPTMFLSGMIISVDVIATSPAMKWLSRFIPFTYTTGNIVEAATPVSHLSIFISGNFDPTSKEYSGAILALRGRTGLNGNDKLVQMILGDQYKIMSSSSNNIFDFSTNYVVRKMPEPDKVRHFIETFLASDKLDASGKQIGDMAKFTELWDDFIQKGNYDFLELFFNQNNVLYEGFEKALNIFIPVGISVGAYWYSIKHFKWSVR